MDLNHPSTRLLIAACRDADLLRNQCAYVLGTAWHESARYKYMREIWGPTPVQRRYEGRTDLGNTVAGDGKKFMGRGFVMITGRTNYSDWSRRLGLDILKEPQLAEQPEIAARIIVEGMKLGTFTGKKLSDYITLKQSDFKNARRIVNGLDKADLIAGYARSFDDLLKDAGYGSEKPPIVIVNPDGVTGTVTVKATDTDYNVPRDPRLPAPVAKRHWLVDILLSLFGKAKP